MPNDLAGLLLSEVLHRNERNYADSVVEALADQGQDEATVQGLPELKACVACLSAGAKNVFSKMCSVELTEVGSANMSCAAQHHDASGIITVSGKFQATIAVHFPRSLVFACSESMLGLTPERMDADAIDLVGELTNMVAGAAKERLGRDGLALGLPTVVAGRDHQVAFGPGMLMATINFASDHGPMAIEVGVKA